MRYHLLSLRLSASFAEHVNLLKVHFIGYVNLGRKVCKYNCDSDNSVPFVMLTRVFVCCCFFCFFVVVFLQSVRWLPQSCLGLYPERLVKC